MNFMPTKKLFLVTTTREAYVYAEDQREALNMAGEVDRGGVPEASALQVRSNLLGWDSDDLVFHSDQDRCDLSIGQVIEIISEEELYERGLKG